MFAGETHRVADSDAAAHGHLLLEKRKNSLDTEFRRGPMI